MAFTVAAAQAVVQAPAGRTLAEASFNNDTLNNTQLTALRAFVQTLNLPAGANPGHVVGLSIGRNPQAPNQISVAGTVLGAYPDAAQAVDDFAAGKLSALIGRVPA